MPSIIAFRPTPVVPDADIVATANAKQVLTRWLRVSTRMTTVLSAYSGTQGLQLLLDSMTTEQQQDLHTLWPAIQAIDAILDAPADIPDLPADEE